jgi:hypothetical protein
MERGGFLPQRRGRRMELNRVFNDAEMGSVHVAEGGGRIESEGVSTARNRRSADGGGRMEWRWATR